MTAFKMRPRRRPDRGSASGSRLASSGPPRRGTTSAAAGPSDRHPRPLAASSTVAPRPSEFVCRCVLEQKNSESSPLVSSVSSARLWKNRSQTFSRFRVAHASFGSCFSAASRSYPRSVQQSMPAESVGISTATSTASIAPWAGGCATQLSPRKHAVPTRRAWGWARPGLREPRPLSLLTAHRRNEP